MIELFGDIEVRLYFCPQEKDMIGLLVMNPLNELNNEFKITEESWTSMVNTLTEVNFMNLLEEFSPDDSDDASSYYIRVETADDVHQSGGYNAGGHMDPESRKFSNARQAVDRALNRNVY